MTTRGACGVMLRQRMLTDLDSTGKPLRNLPRGIWILGFVSLLMDVSSEMIHSLLPLFMVSVLGLSMLTVGALEGFAEAAALLVKIFSGTLSDYLRRRKAIVVAGYALGALSKPFFALAQGAGAVFAARFADRIGKGIRGAPRDALVADLVPPEHRGAAFGLRQSLDTVGAVGGPLLAIALMLLWADDFRAVFWVAVVPAVLSVALLAWGIREPPLQGRRAEADRIRWRALGRLGRPLWWVVGIGAAVTLARFSEAFLVLRASQAGLPSAWTPAVLVAMNLAYALSAYPFGRLSDTMRHSRLLAMGLTLLVAADAALAFGTPLALGLGILLWGLHMGATQGLLARMVADVAPAALRGTAFGLFGLATGIATFLASLIAGALWEFAGATWTFLAGGAFALMALLAIASGPR